MGTDHIGAPPGTSGVRVTQTQPTPASIRSPFGSTGLTGAFQWGPVGVPVAHAGHGDYRSMRGLPMRQDPTAAAAEHWFQASRGAGKLLTLRLVDGSEERASSDLYGRDITPYRTAEAGMRPPSMVVRLDGLYPGRRGGVVDTFSGRSADLSVAFDAAAGAFTTGTPFARDRWYGATLRMDGATRSYRVTGNSPSGVLAIEVPTGDPGPAAGPGTWSLTRRSPDANGERDGLSVRILSSQSRPSDEVRLELWDERTQRPMDPGYESVGLDPTLDSYIDARVNNDTSDGQQRWVEVAAEPVGDPHDPAARPANWVGVLDPDSAMTGVVHLRAIFESRSVSAGGTAHLQDGSVIWPQDPVRCRVDCEFTDPTNFVATFRDWRGAAMSDPVPGVLGSPVQMLGLPTFTVEAGGSAMAAHDELIIWFSPVPSDLATRGGLLYPFALPGGGDLRLAFPITGVTPDSIRLPVSADLAAIGVAAPGRPGSTAPNAGPYDLSVAAARDLTYEIDALAHVTLTSTLSSATTSAADLAADLNAQEALAHPNGAWVRFDVDGGALRWMSLRGFGSAATMMVSASGMGGVLGLSADQLDHGTDGDVLAMSWAAPLHGGQDGVADLGSHGEYEAAWDLQTGPWGAFLRNRNDGLVKMAMPGVSGGLEDAQSAAIAWVREYGHTFRCEVDPGDADNELAASIYVQTNLPADENRALAWDSYGYPRSRPHSGEDVSLPMSGAILGMEARLAAEFGGYHIAAAGPKADIGDIFRRLASTAPSEPPTSKNEAVLNAVGIQAMQQIGRQIYPNGDRNALPDYRGTAWKHKVEATLHLMHQLEIAGRPFVFEPLDAATRGRLVSAILPVLRDLFDAGWFVVDEGQTFFDVVHVSAGPDENPPSVQVLGELRAVIEISGIVGTAERVIFAIGTGGVTAGVGTL